MLSAGLHVQVYVRIVWGIVYGELDSDLAVFDIIPPINDYFELASTRIRKPANVDIQEYLVSLKEVIQFFVLTTLLKKLR